MFAFQSYVSNLIFIILFYLDYYPEQQPPSLNCNIIQAIINRQLQMISRMTFERWCFNCTNKWLIVNNIGTTKYAVIQLWYCIVLIKSSEKTIATNLFIHSLTNIHKNMIPISNNNFFREYNIHTFQLIQNLSSYPSECSFCENLLLWHNTRYYYHQTFTYGW